MKHTILIIVAIFFSSLSFGQDLEKIGGKPLQISGNISIGSSFYKAIDRDNRRSPFAYFLSANPTFTVYGIDIPVSVVYRDQQGSISNPFNRYSINPTYKWVSLHLGNVNIQLNPYTLSGQVIKGAGIELTPGIHANLAASAHTANQESVDFYEGQDLTALREQSGDLLTINFSTKLQLAGDAGFDFKFKRFGFGAEYKRVDPLYKSLGTFYFLEDYENVLAKANFSLFGGKIRFTGRGGLQRNNLSRLRKTTNTRQIMNGSLTIAPSRIFSVTGRYSNFQNERAPGLVAVNDTLRYTRATAIYGVSPRINFGSKERRSSISASINYQNLVDLLDDEDTGRTIDNYNANLTYSLRIRPSNLSLSISALGNQNLIQDNERQRLGGNIRATKKLNDKKLTLSLGVGMFQNFVNAITEGQSITGRLGLRYKVKKGLSMSMNTNYLNRTGTVAYQEFRGNLKMTYSFARKSRSKSAKK